MAMTPSTLSKQRASPTSPNPTSNCSTHCTPTPTGDPPNNHTSTPTQSLLGRQSVTTEIANNPVHHFTQCQFSLTKMQLCTVESSGTCTPNYRGRCHIPPRNQFDVEQSTPQMHPPNFSSNHQSSHHLHCNQHRNHHQ